MFGLFKKKRNKLETFKKITDVVFNSVSRENYLYTIKPESREDYELWFMMLREYSKYGIAKKTREALKIKHNKQLQNVINLYLDRGLDFRTNDVRKRQNIYTAEIHKHLIEYAATEEVHFIRNIEEFSYRNIMRFKSGAITIIHWCDLMGVPYMYIKELRKAVVYIDDKIKK